MASDEAMEQFKAAMASVKRLFDREEYEQALPLCAKALELRPDSDVIRRCKVFALLNLSRWSEGLQESEGSAKESFAFEKGYCLYRLNRFQEALDALKADEESDRRSRLEAQVRYRMGDYESCAKMYEKLYDGDREDVGLIVNAVASHVSGDKPREAIRVMQNQEELLESSYELCFNLACALIDVGRLSDAEARLQQAKEICMAELREEELSAEDEAQLEDHQELAAINVQQGCVRQRQGKLDAANDLYNRVLKQRPGQAEVDITVLAVACNNVVSLRPEGKSLFDSLKRINVASKESLEHKLTRKQNLEISINKCLLLLQAHKPDEAKRELQRLKEMFPDHPRNAIVQAAFAHMEKKPKVCEEALQSYLKDHPGNEEVLLAVAQLHASSNRLDKAVEALAQLPVARRAMPRIAEALVALYQRQKSPEKAVVALREAIDHWSKGTDADEDTLAEVLRISSRLAVQLKDKAFAAEVFQAYLEQIDGGDVQALCGLVKALSSTDPEKAEQYAMRLKVPDYDHLDAEELEHAAIPKIASVLKKGKEKEAAKAAPEEGETTAGEATATEGAEKAEEKTKTKKKRRIRYPKTYDPANPGPSPDPERWLPKHERAEFKKKMRKRDKNMLRGPQGAMSLDDMAFRKAGPSTAQMEVASEKKPSGNKGRSKKGKK